VIINRRRLLTGLIAAPIVVRAGLLMPVKAPAGFAVVSVMVDEHLVDHGEILRSARRDRFMNRSLPLISVAMVRAVGRELHVRRTVDIPVPDVAVFQARAFRRPDSFDGIAPAGHEDFVEVQRDAQVDVSR